MTSDETYEWLELNNPHADKGWQRLEALTLYVMMNAGKFEPHTIEEAYRLRREHLQSKAKSEQQSFCPDI